MRMRRVLVALAVGAVVVRLGAGGTASATPPAPSATPAAAPAPQPDEASALAAARASGVPVEVSGMRSTTQQVFANPDGTLTLTQNLVPVRVLRSDGSWVPVDTTLHPRTDGSVTPGAVPVGLTFSGGGTAPLVTMSRFGRSLSLTWPAPLPVPSLAGDTATYADVMPGVDLRMQATATGFSERLVVTSREAAENPDLAAIAFSVAATGLTLTTDSTGWLRAVDAAGGAVFSGPPPAMWDTPQPASGLTAPDGSIDDGIPGAHRADVGVNLDAGSLSLVPDQSVLTGADTVYPVVIDPSFTYGNPSWTEVNAEDPNSATWRTTPTSLAVGFQDFESPWSRVRSFVHFPLDSRIFGATIRSATYTTFESWSSSCTPRGVELWVTGPFNGSTTWNHQPAWGSSPLSTQVVAKGHDSTCAAGGVEFNATSGVAGAAANHSSITFGLKASSETDDLGWKKFHVTPSLTVVYNRPPATPNAATMSTEEPNSSCVNDRTTAPHVNVLAGTGITLRVRTTDPDGDRVKVEIDFWLDGGGSLALATSAAVASGTTIGLTVLTSTALTDGATYKWRAEAMDVDAGGTVLSTSSVSAWCYVVQDSTAPNEPVVTSTDYPTDAYAGGAGQSGVFSISPGSTGDTSLSGYEYGIDDNVPTFVAADASGNASVSVAPPSYGPHDLNVQAKDGAGNLSSTVAYHFYVDSPTDTTAYWRMDEGTGATITGSDETDPEATTGPTAALSPGGVQWTDDGKINKALNFDGMTGSVGADTARIDTSQSFTVTAWARLTSKADYATAVSQDGVHESGFYLQYSLGDDRWGMAMQSVDSDTVSTIRASGEDSPKLNTWTHLAGVYDGAA